MIPDFKTFLNESLWADVQSQAAGDTIKKEDDINRMDVLGLDEYTSSRYEVFTDRIGHAEDTNDIEYVYVPVLRYKDDGDKVYYLCRDFPPQDTITINIDLKHLDHDIYEKLNQQYSLSVIMSDYLKIEPKDGGNVDNEFFFEVLDFIIDNADKSALNVKKLFVNESLWADVQNQASGNTVKKEDDVNRFDAKGFYDYIQKKYVILDQWTKFNYYVRTYQIDISVPIYMDKSTLHLSGPVRDSFTFHLNFEMKENIKMDDNNRREITMFPTMESINYSVDFRKSILYNKLCDEFHVYKKHHMGLPMLHIEPKDGGKVDNNFYLRVLDFITDNYDESEHKVLGKA